MQRWWAARLIARFEVAVWDRVAFRCGARVLAVSGPAPMGLEQR